MNASHLKEPKMQHKSKAQVVALFLALTASLLVINRLSAADRPADAAAKQNTPPKTPSLNNNSYVPYVPYNNTYKPGSSPAAAITGPNKAAATEEKLKNLGALLGRALDVAIDLLSGNETDLLSRNKTALLSGNKSEILSGNRPEILSGNKPEILSGNKPEILSGNKPEILSGNKPKVLSGNRTPILSGNTFSVLSNIKVEIHINNSGNNVPPGPMAQPRLSPATPSPAQMFPPSNYQPGPTPAPGPGRPGRDRTPVRPQGDGR
jgi:hypothetical protein